MRSAAGQFTASACNFVNWDNRSVGSAAIQLDAGKAIVQGCTFSQDNLHVQVGSAVASAILTANQATDGFRFDNQAGKRTQVALNEEQGVNEWHDAARAHYRIHIGQLGDRRYLRDWHGAEKPARWSQSRSWLHLPVIPGKPYTITIKANIPPQAVAPETGLYLDGKQIAPLKSGSVLTATLPPAAQDHIRLELRCQGWIPQKLDAKSNDPRTLGVQAFTVDMRAADAEEKIFNANTSQWLPANKVKPN
jgi:hypothetical protein